MNHGSLRSLQVLIPSRIEIALACLLLGIITFALVTPSIYKGSDVETYFNYIEKNPTKLQTDYAGVSQQVNSSPLAADVSVFALWALAGLAGYGIVESIIGLFMNLKRFREELDYANTDRSAIIIDSLAHLLVRLIATLALYLLILFIFSRLVPYVLLLIHHPSPYENLTAIGVLAGLTFVVLVTFHALTVLLRLVFLRTRLFFSNI
jgi:hypothetical protein